MPDMPCPFCTVILEKIKDEWFCSKCDSWFDKGDLEWWLGKKLEEV